MKPSEYNPDELAFDALHLHEAHVKGTVELTDRFMSVGEVSLNSAQVDGGVFCRGGTFFQHDGVALSMDGIKVGGSVYLDEYIERTPPPAGSLSDPVRFVAHGTVSMRGAVVEHRLVITKAHFLKQHNESSSHCTWPPRDPLREREGYAFFAKRLKVAGDMFFNKDAGSGAATDNEFKVIGRICLENAHIGARLFLAARPADPSDVDFVDLGFVQVAAAAHLEIRPPEKREYRVCLRSARVDSLDVSTCAHERVTWVAAAAHLEIRPPEKREYGVCLRSARVGSLDVSACAHEWVTWDLEGLHYDAIEKVEHVTLDGTAKSNPDWVTVWTDAILQKRGKLSTGAVQPFDALMAFLRKSGRDEAAGDVGIAKEQKITNNVKVSAFLSRSAKNDKNDYLGIAEERTVTANMEHRSRNIKKCFARSMLLGDGSSKSLSVMDTEQRKLSYYLLF